MSGVTGKEDISLVREDVAESRFLAKAVKTLIFKHEASIGDTEIDLTNLVAPSEALAGGFIQPTSTDLASANLLTNKRNFRLHSSRGVELQQWEDFIVTGNTKIRLIGNIVDLGGALEGEVFTGYIAAVPVNNFITTDTKFFTRTYDLSVGQTLLNLGVEYEVGKGLIYDSQVGSIQVFRAGQIQARNAANAPASVSADGNYHEIDSGSGVGTQIQFNIAPTLTSEQIIVVFGVSFAGDFSLVGDMEALNGAFIKLIEDAAPAFGWPESRYLNFNPSAVERRAFGDLVSDLLNRVEDLEGSSGPAPAASTWTKYTKTFSDLAVADTFNQITLFSLPAKALIRSIVIHHTTAFTGGALSNYTVRVGITSDTTKYASHWSVFPASDGAYFFQLFHADEIENMTTATNILLTAESTNDFLNVATQGSVDIYVEWITLP